MSGTSLDGTDIALCTFTKKGPRWSYKINHAQTIPYSIKWKKRLGNLENATALTFAQTNADYGHYLGHLTLAFMKKHRLSVNRRNRPDFISSHGHTVFHQPLFGLNSQNKARFNSQNRAGLSSQVGDGAGIAAESGLPVICDFRSKDIALGGQGAPMVPVGDALLFSKYSAFLNLGGFANCSTTVKKNIQAFDICPLNIVFNQLSIHMGKNFDSGGNLARRGKINVRLLNQLNSLSYYRQKPPKSLGKEWVIKKVLPMLEKSRSPAVDQLRTFSEHAAIQISSSLINQKNVLVTGGGTYNSFLLERLAFHSGKKTAYRIPDRRTIEFKEALIFAFLGVLRWRGEINSLKSVTGAKSDTISGCVYF